MWKRFWNPSTCSCENGKCLASNLDNSAIICDKVTEPYDKETNFNEKKQPVRFKISNFLRAVSFYC